jgi:hypothetical protein
LTNPGVLDRRGMAESSSNPLATLQDVLAAAARIAHDLSNDRLLPRLVEVFARMPAEDRETILRVLEREVDLRTHSKESPHAALAGLHPARANQEIRSSTCSMAPRPPTGFFRTEIPIDRSPDRTPVCRAWPSTGRARVWMRSRRC